MVDTDVFSRLFTRKRTTGDPIADRWRDLLHGRRILISFQTKAEVLAGALGGGWGEGRTDNLRVQLRLTPTILVDDEVLNAYVDLTARCRASGHALHAKDHNADRWIAACAIAKDLPLLWGDHIFVDTPSLELLDA